MEENTTTEETMQSENSINNQETEISNNNPSPENQIASLEKEVAEQKDKYLRLFAEFDNYKRRSAKERMELTQTAGKEIIVSLLDILDDCDRAEKQLKDSDVNPQNNDGTLLIFNKLRTLLTNKGLKVMESMHTDFDVEKHEAITEIDVPQELKGKVIDELVKGYYLNEKLIRFAKVVVGK